MLRRALHAVVTLLVLANGILCARRIDAQLRVRETSLGARPSDTIPGTSIFSSSLDVAYIRSVGRGERVVINGVAGPVFTAIPRVRLSEAGRVSSIMFSADGKHVAYVAALNNKFIMVLDAVAGAAYDHIAVGSAWFSPDGNRVTYVAKRGEKNLVVADGREGVPYDAIGVRHVAFTSDSKHVVYTATVGDRHVVVRDGKELTTAEYVGDPVLSKSGNRLAYTVMRDNAWSVVLDGVQGKPFRSIGNNLIFSKDAQHLVFRGRDADDHIVLDGIPGVGFGSIRENSYNMSEDGLHVAFVARDRGQDFWVLDNVPQKMYDWVSGDPVFSADGRSLTYVAEEGGRKFVVIGTAEGERFDSVTEFPQFSVDHHVWYVAQRGAQQFVAVDTVATAYDRVSSATITRSGTLVTIAKRDSRWSVYLNGRPGAMYDEAPASFMTSDDGKLQVYAASRNAKQFVCINGKESAPYDDVRALTISSDGRHVGFIAFRGNAQMVVVDGLESPGYDEVQWLKATNMQNDKSFVFLARRGKTDLRVITLTVTKPKVGQHVPVRVSNFKTP